MDTLYKKYTLKEVEPIIKELVAKSIEFEDTSEKLLKDFHEKYGYGSLFDEDKEREEKLNEWNEKWGTNPYDEELSNLTRYNTPIRNDKKCCMNCTRIFCHLRDNNWHYCKEYNPTHWQEIYYVRFSYNKEPAPKPSLEQRINDSTKAYLEDYKKLLKHCDELEKEVPKKIITKPFNQKDLDVEEKYQEWSKRYWKDFEDTFDKEEHKIEGDGPFAGVTLYSAKPNEERQKAFFEKYKTCPMAAMAKDIGLLKEEK